MADAAPSSSSRATPTRGQLQYWKRKLSVTFEEVKGKLGASAFVTCVSNALKDPDLRSSLQKALGEEPDALKAQVAEAIAENSAKEPVVQAAVAKAAQDVIGSRAKSKRLLHVPGKKTWKRILKGTPKLKPGRKSRKSIVNSRQTIQKVRVFLHENSNPTAKLMKVGTEVLKVYNLKRSRHKL